MKSFQASLQNGRQATIPMTITRNFRLNPSTSSADSTIPVAVGFHRSVRSVLATRKLSSNINNASADEFVAETLAGLKNYYFQVGSQRFPRNKVIETQNDTSSGAPSAEHYMQALCSIDNTWPHMNAVTHSGTNTSQFLYYNFASNRSFGAGIPSEDGQLVKNLSHNSAPSATDMDLFLSIDAVMKLDASDISISTQEF